MRTAYNAESRGGKENPKFADFFKKNDEGKFLRRGTQKNLNAGNQTQLNAVIMECQ